MSAETSSGSNAKNIVSGREIALGYSFFLSFFLSWETKPQLNHCTNKRVVSTQ